jgi:hypothetical protein
MIKKEFDQFIFDDDILGEIPTFKNGVKKITKKNVLDNKKVLFRDISLDSNNNESLMLSVPVSDYLDNSIADQLDGDFSQISNSIGGKNPIIINIDSKSLNTSLYSRTSEDEKNKYDLSLSSSQEDLEHEVQLLHTEGKKKSKRDKSRTFSEEVIDTENPKDAKTFSEEEIDTENPKDAKTFSEEVIDTENPKDAKTFSEEEIDTENLGDDGRLFYEEEIVAENLGNDTRTFSEEAIDTKNLGDDGRLFNEEEIVAENLGNDTRTFSEEAIDTKNLGDDGRLFNEEEIVAENLGNDTRTFSEEAIDTENLGDETNGEIKSIRLNIDKSDSIIKMSSASISVLNDEIVNKSEFEMSYDGKTGNYKLDKNGNISEGEVAADSYAEFLSKIYEPLMGMKDSMSDYTVDTGSLSSEEDVVKSHSDKGSDELIINISHEKKPSKNTKKKSN